MSNRHWQGFGLSLLTAIMWGILPVFLKLCLLVLDSATITWYRFTFAALFVLLVLLPKRALPPLHKFGGQTWGWVLLASLALVVNYVLNVQGLVYIDPETVQVVMQLAPFLLMLGGVVIFKEPFSPLERAGALLLFVGLMLFFNQRLPQLFASFGAYTLGVVVVVCAALAWAVYALVQKVLLRRVTAKQLTLLMYATGAFILLPAASLGDITGLDPLQAFALIFCCFNTIIAYGAFTEALAIWHAAKVSAVIALAPLFTFISNHLAVLWRPDLFSPSDLSTLSYIGAAMVVGACMTISLGKIKR